MSINAGSFVLSRVLNGGSGASSVQRNPGNANEFLFGGLASPNQLQSLNVPSAAQANPPALPPVQASGLDALASQGLAQINMNQPARRANPNTKEGRIQNDLNLNRQQYTVQSGDTLSHIARAIKNQYGLNQSINELVDQLAESNGIENKNLIFPDQQINFSSVLG